MVRIVDLPLEEIVLDFEFYPRTQVSDVHVRRLRYSLECGDILPPVRVCKKTKRLADGFHRYRVHQGLKRPTIKAELINYPDDAAFYADAVRCNTGHGQPLSPFEQRRVAIRAEALGFTREQVGEILRIAPSRVEEFRRVSATVSNGEPIPLKRGLETLDKQALTPKQEKLNEQWGGMNVTFYARQITAYLEAGAYRGDLTLAMELDKLVALWSETRSTVQAGTVG